MTMKPNDWTRAKVMAAAMELERREADFLRAAIPTATPREPGAVSRLEHWVARKEARVRAISEWAKKAGVILASETSTLQNLPVDPRLGDRDWEEAALLGAYSALAKSAIEKLRAFRFFTYVAAEATDAETKALAESLAREQLIEAADLRDARRRAWRDEGRELLRWRDLLKSFADLAIATEVTRAIETRAADQIEKLACEATAQPDEARKLRKAVEVLRIAGAASPGLPQRIADLVFSPLTARTPIDRARQLLQRLLDVSDLVAKHTDNEDILGLAQQTAANTITAVKILGAIAEER